MDSAKIDELEPFQKVLGRDNENDFWKADFFSYYREGDSCPYKGVGYSWKECIPYEGNEHLLGTTDSLKPKWQPKPGEAVFVRDNDVEHWRIRLFVKMHDKKYMASVYEHPYDCGAWNQCKPYNAPEE